ncbi:MAG: mechanosensitive ion channel [Cyanobacteria bacterium CRU_2_1]|nr:mechanosensitive ion channel [Cyanobacteria bacterium RU_5_0]NJR62984.1 mechanosensitive ion channel [Cyanobacteria bacterium CRU_2_1]
MNQIWCVTLRGWHEELNLSYWLAQASPVEPEASFGQFLNRVWAYLPSVLGAIAILIIGWLIATIIASAIKGLLNRTNLDNRLAAWVTGQTADATAVPIEKWVSIAVFWIIMAFVLVAFFNALQLEVVSAPLNSFLEQIFNYLPRIGGAALLLLVAWALASLSKLILTRGLARFNLDDRLAAQTGGEASPFLLSETLGNALYWFIFLFFLPVILDVLQLQGPLLPVQNLLNDILAFLPKLIYAIIIAAVGWLIARIVRGIVTNLLAAIGTDQLGMRVGLTRASGNLSLSALIGTIVYVLILIPTAIAALNALQIRAISEPAISMLQDILEALPLIFTATLILILFYVIGRFVADLVANILTSIGFNNIFTWLGFPAITPPPPSPIDLPPPVGPETVIQPPIPPTPRQTPSEVIGIIVLVGIMLLGAVAATEVLGFEVLTAIVNGILWISARVLSGLIVFGVGLYLANLAFSLIGGSGGRQAQIFAQVARIAIIALVAAMALQQMGIASNIVNLAFGLLVGAIAVAIALAFGLGGRDLAADQIRDWLSSLRDNQS